MVVVVMLALSLLMCVDRGVGAGVGTLAATVNAC